MLLNKKVIEPLPFPSDLKFVKNIQFIPGMGGTSRQLSPWHGLAIHITGGERTAPNVIRTLKQRGLSIHFIVDPDGTVTQTADLSTRASHCGKGNGYFVGIEVVSRGYANKVDLAVAMLKNPDLRIREPIDWAAERDVYRDKIAEDRVNLVAFNPAQVKAVVWLAEALSKQLGFPRKIPAIALRDASVETHARMPVKDPKSFVVTHEGVEYFPAFDRDTSWRPKNFKGAICHFQIHETKHCGGTQILYKLWSLGWNPTGRELPNAV